MHQAIIRTERLWMRETNVGDAEAIFTLNADPEVIRWTGDTSFNSIAEAREFLLRYRDFQAHGFGRWALLRSSDNKMLGWCGLKRHPNGQVDVGFRLQRCYWGNGYATEAAKACIEWGFREAGLDEIIGRVARENHASVRVLEKLGMQYWKEEECHGIPDALVYRIKRPGDRSLAFG